MSDVVLRTVDEPFPKTRAVVKPQRDYMGPLFIGQDGGVVNYLCGSCGQAVAQAIWEDSIRNVIVQCFSCHSFSEFPPDPFSRFTNRVFLLSGTYNFRGPVYLEFGKLLEGESMVGPPVLSAEGVGKFLLQQGIHEPLSRNDLEVLIRRNGGTTGGLDLSGRNLSGIDLSGLDLSGMILNDCEFGPLHQGNVTRRSVLDQAKLTACSLDRAKFDGASMKATQLTSSSAIDADFRQADLSDASFLGAKLHRANFRWANLSRTDFNNADLDAVSVGKARLKTASFAGSNWGPKYVLGDELESHKQAEEAYRSLRLWHQHAGIDNIAGEFRYRELISKRKRRSELLRISVKNHRLPNSLKDLLKLAPLVCAEMLFGYGERWKRILFWWAATIISFALAFYLWSIIVNPVFVGCTGNECCPYAIYYSAASFTALGYGSWAPEPIGWAKYAGLAESIIGPILIAMFITTFARIWSR
jgi:uncharacterized protein YjbI with pentapeptide repeats